jgi:hypothetical protein
MNIRLLLERAQPGTHSSVEGHIKRGERVAKAIQERFGVSEPRQWQAKHLRWVLTVWAADRSLATRYDYWRTARSMAAALGKWPAWEPHLRGGAHCLTGRKNGGGRPPKLAYFARYP